jgi:hypothetical protein
MKKLLAVLLFACISSAQAQWPGYTKGAAAAAAGGGSGTVTNTGGSLTANSVVLGAGTDDTKVLYAKLFDHALTYNSGHY